MKYRDLQGLTPQEAVALVYGAERARDDLIVVLTDCIDEKGGCPAQPLPRPGSD